MTAATVGFSNLPHDTRRQVWVDVERYGGSIGEYVNEGVNVRLPFLDAGGEPETTSELAAIVEVFRAIGFEPMCTRYGLSWFFLLGTDNPPERFRWPAGYWRIMHFTPARQG